jgi:radical SAM protein with 4Fe4S-binding SPASM domain
MKRVVTHMDLRLLTKIIDEVADKHLATPSNPIGLCGIGEPTLHPELLSALDVVKRVPFGFGTNCEALTPSIAEALIKAKFTDFNLSIDAYTGESHAKIKPGLHFYKVFGNALGFLSMLKGKDFWRQIMLQFIVLDLNVEEARDFIFFWLAYIKNLPNTTIYIKPVCKWPSANGDSQHYPSPKFRKVESNRVLYANFDDDVGFRGACNLFDTFCQIQSDGSYSPCCMNSDDEFEVGNIRDATIEELYSSPKMEEYRHLFSHKEFDKIPYCGNCYEGTISS